MKNVENFKLTRTNYLFGFLIKNIFLCRTNSKFFIMFNLSWPLLKADPYEGSQLIIPADSDVFIKKVEDFFHKENNVYSYTPLKRRCTVNDKLQFDLTGMEVYIVTFPYAPKILAETVLNYITTY